MKHLSTFAIPIILVFLSTNIFANSSLDQAIDKYNYSAELTAGNQYKWDVSTSSLFSDQYLVDGTEITLKVLKDLAGVIFTGNITANDLSPYFDVSFGDTTFDFKDEIINLLVFPTSITFQNTTTINPIKGYWINEIYSILELKPDANITLDVKENGDLTTFRAEIITTEQGLPSTIKLNATISSKTGLLKEYRVQVIFPIGEPQTVVVTQKELSITSETSSSSQVEGSSISDSQTAPINPLWLFIPLFILPLLKIKRKIIN